MFVFARAAIVRIHVCVSACICECVFVMSNVLLTTSLIDVRELHRERMRVEK